MNPFLYIFYHFFKLIVRASLWVFYRRTTVANRAGAKIKGPYIVAVNHPSTVLDPLNAAVHIPRIVHFLANASLFKTRFTNWFFNTFYCIPIERYQDTGGKPLNNAASFARAIAFLSGGGCLLIAPEGSSYVERRLRKLKTGLARIALNTEAANGFQLGLRILPVGLNYSDPTQFRSAVLTIFGDPIRVADFRKDWEADEVAAVQNLTAKLREHLVNITTDCTDGEEQVLLEKIEEVVQIENPLPPFEAFQRSQNILAELKTWREEAPEKIERLSGALLPNVGGFAKGIPSENHPLSEVRPLGFSEKLLWFLSSPIAMLGLAIHFPPCFSTKKLSDRLNDDLHWIPTFKYCLGLLVYPSILVLETWLVSKLPGHWPRWAFILAIVPLGLLAEWWLERWAALRANVRPEIFAEQKQKRREVMEMLNL